MNRRALAAVGAAATIGLLTGPGMHPAAAVQAPEPTVVVVDGYQWTCHSSLSNGPAGSRLWIKSSKQPQQEVAKGACKNVWDADGSGRVYPSYPSWRARKNVAGAAWGPCHVGYKWIEQGPATEGYTFRGFINSVCGG